MPRFDELPARYRDGSLDREDRAELSLYVARDADCRDAFVEVVCEQRIRRLEFLRT